jgi:FMN phosphatase YigB (HAD superfamily)
MIADLVFDLDRTLWDFDRNSREVLAEVWAEWGADWVGSWTGREVTFAAFLRQIYGAWGRWQNRRLCMRRAGRAFARRGVEALR